jgi:DNA polymerase III delta prime subunit
VRRARARALPGRGPSRRQAGHVLIGPEGTPLLTDFGLAQLSDHTGITEQGTILGTIPYLSTEACAGQPLDERTDIWSLGVLFYELVVGERPFVGSNATALIAAITSAQPRPLAELRPGLPPALTSLIEQMLIKDREARTLNARQIGGVLTTILADTSLGHDTPGPDTLMSTLDQARSLPTAAEPRRREALATETVGGTNDLDVSPEREKLLVLLDRVERFWIRGILDKTVTEASALQLRHRSNPAWVKHPWEDLVKLPGSGDHAASSRDAYEAFVEAERSLLILGEPGAGKTITLLRLARRLAEDARREPRQAIPVVLNHSSWAEVREPLEDWIVRELTAKYQIPRELGREWIADDVLVLLLDELDGAQRQDNAACIRAINAFRREHGLTGVVVCRRRSTYLDSDERLELGGALALEPLDEAQIAKHISRRAAPGLRERLERDPELRKLATSPLMLEIVERLHEGEDPQLDALADRDALIEAHGALDQRRRQLFAAYVSRMNRRAAKRQTSTSTERMLASLSWLARQMLAHNQATFLLEMQPSWLPSRAWRWVYVLLTRTLLGLIVGVCWGVISSALAYQSDFYQAVQASRPGWGTLPANLVAMLGLGLATGLAMGVIETRCSSRGGVGPTRLVWTTVKAGATTSSWC